MSIYVSISDALAQSIPLSGMSLKNHNRIQGLDDTLEVLLGHEPHRLPGIGSTSRFFAPFSTTSSSDATAIASLVILAL
jgi:hypothetical protein